MSKATYKMLKVFNSSDMPTSILDELNEMYEYPSGCERFRTDENCRISQWLCDNGAELDESVIIECEYY